MIVYNIPQRVVLNLEPDVLAELATIPNVVAVKQATADLDQAQRIVEETGLVLYAGNDDLCCRSSSSAEPAASASPRTSRVARCRSMIDLAHQGDMAGARAVDESLHGLYAGLAVTTNPIPVKAALNLLGHDVGGLRLPLVEADAGETQAVAAALEASGILARA